MPKNLLFSISFLQPRVHGRGDGGEPEWPPSPLRLVQALVAASAGRWNERRQLEYATPAFRWLELLPPPVILAAKGLRSGVRIQFYVPDNTTELVVPAWKKGEVDKAPKRTEKVVRPTRLSGDALHYLFPLPDEPCKHLETLQAAARSITHLGWGIDMAVGNASIISAEDAARLQGERWSPSAVGDVSLRVPKEGTLTDLMRKHTDFLNRISSDGFRPVPPLRVFDVVQYRSQFSPPPRPFRLFELRNLDGSRHRYPHRKLIHIAGMVRHLAIDAMKTAGLPRGVADDWIETYVAGHRKGRKTDLKDDQKCKGTVDAALRDDATALKQIEPFDGADEHRQLSYVPLPSAGHEHVDPGVRRVMIVAPLGDDALLDQVARRLGGQQLLALNEKTPEFGVDENGLPKPGPILVPLPRSGDGVTRQYTTKATTWASFTPVILPGHDDHKPQKTRKLIEKALAQSGIDQPCEFEWSPFSRFPKSFSAHKYARVNGANEAKRRIGYIRPDHLLDQTAVHLVLRFGRREDPADPASRWIPAEHRGPLILGAGRHCGFGLMAAVE